MTNLYPCLSNPLGHKKNLNSKEMIFFMMGIGEPKEQEKILKALMRRD